MKANRRTIVNGLMAARISMSPRIIAAAGILLLEVVLTGCTLGGRTTTSVDVEGTQWKPIGNRKAKVVLWGIVHNHARGKFEALRKLTNDYEIVGWVDDTASTAMRTLATSTLSAN